MVFGKIDYLNLLPFHVFMKRFTRSSQQSMSMHYRRGVPAKINEKFLSRRVDAAFISSIHAQKHKHVNLGIIAKKEVLSVLVVPNVKNEKDIESATSNVLAKVLDIKGKILIGDKALKHYLEGKPNIDLAAQWNTRHKLPFVFALLCYHKDRQLYKNIERQFSKRKIKIPQYLLNEASLRTEISKKDILNYLSYISYDLDNKAKKGLSLFYKSVKK
ncbi:MqnA/MqnD/SBP family protein [Sulfurimonas sp.]|uniref:MqnA/MqnD/SBP family protein n=1 Tax=Sulfurimonas sp. TaxID=2022749 RepID=UPI0025E0CE6A|nr:MqnA/MqnD/SBP family protein [Sulfurimonas sp.]